MSLVSKGLNLSNRILSNKILIRSLAACSNKLNLSNKKPSFLSQTKQPIVTLSKLNYSTGQANDIKKRIDTMVKNKPVVVFMKGTPNQPMCGFSKAVVDILNIHGVKFDAYNVLADESLRSGIKEYSNWPTIPQVFFNGEFVGGCDILLEMHKSHELVEELKKIGIKSKLDDDE